MKAQDIEKLVKAANEVKRGLSAIVGDAEELGKTSVVDDALDAKNHADQAALYLTWLEPF
jgi:hypothetical protein